MIMALLVSLLLTDAHARKWTSADGAKTFEGDLTSYDPATGKMGVKLTNGKEMNFDQKVLSEADIAYLKEKAR